MMPTTIERTEGHYEVQEVDFGRVYRWRPASVEVGCGCGERLALTASCAAVCPRCGADHAPCVREALRPGRSEDPGLHPWRYDARNLDETGLPW